MPFLLIPVFTTLLGASLAGTAFLGTTVAGFLATATFGALSLAAQFGLQSSEQRKAKKAARRNALQGQGNGQSVQQTIRLSVDPRRRHYGRVKIGGTLVFLEVKGDWLYQAIVFNSGTISEFEEFLVTDKPVLRDSDGAVTTAPFWISGYADPNLRSYVRIEPFRGYLGQNVSSILKAAFPTDWTDAHVLNGLAYAVIASKQTTSDRYQTVYNSQVPGLAAVIRGVFCYDMRSPAQIVTDPTSWTYSENPPVCLYDYFAVGQDITRSFLDTASFAAAADICDERVLRKDGTYEPRYRLSGAYSFDEEPRQVSERMLDTMRGELDLTPEGNIALRVAQWIEPDFTITEEMIVSIEIEHREGLLNEFNAVKVFFTSPDHNWQETQAHTIRDEDAVTRLGREVVDETRLPMVFSHTQAQRLAKIELYEDNPEWLGEMVLHVTALNIVGKRVFRLIYPDLDLNIVCRITKFTLPSNLERITVGFESIDPRAYEWDPITEEGPAPALPPDTSDDPTQPGPPTGLVSFSELFGAGVKVGLRWKATDRTGQVYDVRYRKLTSDPWIQSNGIADKFHITDEIALAETYTWEVRLRTTQGGVSSWASASFTTADPGAFTLIAPTAFAPLGGQENILFSATQSSSLGAWALEFNAVAVGSGVSWVGSTIVNALPGVTATASKTALVGSFDVYSRARSMLGTVTSSAVGPVTVAVTALPPSGSGSGNGGDGGGTGGGSEAASGGSGSGVGGGSGAGSSAGEGTSSGGLF